MVWWWVIDNGSGVVFTSERNGRLSTHTPEEPARRIPSLTKPAKTNYICVSVRINRGGGSWDRYSGEGSYVI